MAAASATDSSCSGRQAAERRGERGSASLAAIATIGVFLVAFTLFAQFAAWQYGRGAVRSAAMEAARAASTVEPLPGACERRFADVRGDLLGGPLGAQVGAPSCVVGPDTVTVTVDARFERWLPFSPDWSFTVTAVAVRELEPA